MLRLEKKISQMEAQERGIRVELEHLRESLVFFSREKVEARGMADSSTIEGKRIALSFAVRAVRELLAARRRVLKVEKKLLRERRSRRGS